MRSSPASSLLWLGLIVACKRGDPWAPCRQSPVAFSAALPQCATDGCHACAAQLDEVWRARRDPAKRAEFRVNFMRASADARDHFIGKTRPDGTFAYEHCTAGTARGASCAMFSPVCVDVFARGLRSGATSVPQRTQMNLAVDGACDAPRAALVASLLTCEPDLGESGCASPACRDCTVGRLAALALLAPTADQPERTEAFRSLVRGTPEPVARRIAESLGAPDAPADLDPVVVRRGLRAYCVDLLGHSATSLPYGCQAPLGMLLTHPEYTREFDEVWTALQHATADAQQGVVDRVLGVVARQDLPTPAVLENLDDMPPASMVDAYRRALQFPNITVDGANALRQRLDRIGNIVVPPPAPTPAPPPDPGMGGGPAV